MDDAATAQTTAPGRRRQTVRPVPRHEAAAARTAVPAPPTTSPSPRLPRWLRWVVGGLAAVALLLRMGMLGRSLTVLDRMFIPDDTYYTLAIAKSLAEGTGPSADGGATLTTGFQPLIAFLTAPVFWLTDDPGVPVRVVLGLLSVSDVAVVVLLGLLAFRVAGAAGAVVAAAVWALSPLSLAIAMNGLEASLAVALSLGLVEAWCRARRSTSARRWVLVGALAGLCLLARVDTVFLIGALGVLELAGRRIKGLLIAAAAAVVVVLPWWAVSVALTGSPVPESGGAVANLVDYHRSIGLTVPRSLALATGRVIGAPVADLPELRGYLEAHQLRGLVVTALVCGLMVAAGAWWARSRRRDTATSTVPMLALGVHGAVILLFYGVVNAAPWFYDRYLLPTVAVLTLVAATVVGRLCQWALARRGAGRSSAAAAPLAAVGLPAVAAAVVVSVVGTVHLFRLQPEGSVAAGYDGAKGYAEVARSLLAEVPDGAVLGSLQTGALAYFSQVGPGDVEVVNLDGVVDGDAAAALDEERLADYAGERGMTHFADWPFNVDVFLRHSERAVQQPEFEEVAAEKVQGIDRFLLFRVSWPAPARG